MKEKQKTISSFYTNMYISKIVVIIAELISILLISFYWDTYWRWDDFKNQTDSLFNSVIGYYIIYMPCTQNGYMSLIKNFNRRKRKNASGIFNSSYYNNRKAYETLSVLPLKKYEIISMDIKMTAGNAFILAAALIGSNIIYILNPYLERSAGFFVIITLNSLMAVIGDFFAKYYYKHFACIMEICSAAVYFILVTINLVMEYNSKIRNMVNVFLEFGIFKMLAGIPMIALCVLTAVSLFMLYKKTDFERGEMSAWRMD